MNLVARLISGAKIDDPDDCWIWQRSTSDFGHGVISVGGRKGRNERAHRMAYQLFVESIPEGEVVRHRCDNPACINPKHLVLGSQYDNVRDMMRRHRHISGFAKLNPDKVVEIRERMALGALQYEVAVDYRVTERTVQNIVSRETWKDAEEATWQTPCSVTEQEVPF
jgi:hypothetical protein